MAGAFAACETSCHPGALSAPSGRLGVRRYALGHRAENEASPLIEALLRAGRGSALTSATCLWWRDLIRFPPREIHVAAPGRSRSGGGVIVHHPDRIVREWHRALPVVPVGDALLASASCISFAGLRRAIALTDKRGLLPLEEIAALGRSRRRGSRTVREALARHMPQLAETNSPLEDEFSSSASCVESNSLGRIM